jgi:Zn/Cd-binding protein ZinT
LVLVVSEKSARKYLKKRGKEVLKEKKGRRSVFRLLMEEVVLKIPCGRQDAKEWIMTQAPEVVADIFDVAQELIKFTSSMASVQVSSKAQDIARITQQHLKSLSEKDDVIRGLNAEVEELKTSIDSKALEQSKRQMRSNEELHKNQLDELVRRQEEMLANNQHQMKSSYENIIRRYEEDIDRLKVEINTMKFAENSTNSHMSDVLRESTNVLKQFTRDVNTGFTGEELVRSVFEEELNIGFLEDTSRSTEPGSEDYLWRCEGDPHVTASVEVKFKSSIHSIHDMQKHRERIYEAARMQKISIGIFMSLKCKIPNKPIMSVENVSGIPVVYAALGNGMSPKQVIHTAFVIAQALARRIKTEDQQTHSQTLIDHVVTSFDKFMKNLNKQQDLIHTMRRQVNQNFRCLESMEKIKNEMISGIEGLRTDYPCLCPVVDDTDSNDGMDAVQMILEYLEKNKRYPTTTSQLPDGTVSSQTELDELVKLAKREKKRKL